MVFPVNPLRVRFARPVEDIIQWIYDEGIGHHWVAGLGHVGQEVQALAKLCGPGFRLIEG